MEVNSSSLSSQKPSYLPRIAIATVVVVGVISVAGVIFGAIAMSTPSQTIVSWSSPFDLLSNDLAPDALLFSSICSLSLCTIILASYSLYKSKKNSSTNEALKTRASVIKGQVETPRAPTERSDLSKALVLSRVPARPLFGRDLVNGLVLTAPQNRRVLEFHPLSSPFKQGSDAASIWLHDALGYRLFPQPSTRKYKQQSIEGEIRELAKKGSQSWLENSLYPKQKAHYPTHSRSVLKLEYTPTTLLFTYQTSDPIKNLTGLPDELQLHVLSFLNVQDLASFMSLSTRCNSIGLIYLQPRERSLETPGLGLESALETHVIAPKIEFAFTLWGPKKQPPKIEKSTPQEQVGESPKVEIITKILECLGQAGIQVDRALIEKDGVISYALLRNFIGANLEKLMPHLNIFASKGILDVVRAICEKQTLSTYKRAQALFHAAKGNQIAIIRYLLAGSNRHPDAQAKLNAGIIQGFCAAGYLNLVKEYLARVTISPLDRNHAIFHAAKGGHVDLIDLLCGETPTPGQKAQIIKGASLGGHLHILEIDKYGLQENTPIAFDAASEGGHTLLIEWLLNRVVGRDDVAEDEAEIQVVPNPLPNHEQQIWMLRGAARGGQRALIERYNLTHGIFCFGIEEAYELAARGNHTSVIELFLSRWTAYKSETRKILYGAIEGGHVALYSKYAYAAGAPYLSASDRKEILFKAIAKAPINIVLGLVYDVTQDTREKRLLMPLREEILEHAARYGRLDIVRSNLHRDTAISTYHYLAEIAQNQGHDDVSSFLKTRLSEL